MKPITIIGLLLLVGSIVLAHFLNNEKLDFFMGIMAGSGIGLMLAGLISAKKKVTS